MRFPRKKGLIPYLLYYLCASCFEEVIIRTAFFCKITILDKVVGYELTFGSKPCIRKGYMYMIEFSHYGKFSSRFPECVVPMIILNQQELPNILYILFVLVFLFLVNG